jgi:hypothetical protein
VLRRFLIAVLLFLIVVVVAADRVGAVVGARVLASKLQTDEHLPHRPSTTIGGIPFLTQAFSGKYRDVSVTAHGVPVDGVSVTTLSAHLHGVHLPLGKVIGDSVSQVPVDRVDGTAFVSFADANRYLRGRSPKGVVVSLGAGRAGRARVTETAQLHGRTVTAHGFGSASVSDDVVTIVVSGLTSSPTRVRLPRSATVSLPLRELPFRISLRSVSIGATGISAVGGSGQVVLGSHPND